MRTICRPLCGLLLAALCLGSAQAADPMVQLASDKGCFICHATKPEAGANMPLAPSYAEIAERYQGKSEVFDSLVNRVLHGTAYTQQNWEGKTSMRFMPPNVNVGRMEAAALVNWILEGESASEETKKHMANLAMATNAGCMTCHLVDSTQDSRLIPLAPSFRAIAGRYIGQADAKKHLVTSVKQGTAFKEKTWHNANMRFMPPNPQLRSQDAELLVDWILALRPKGNN